MSKIIHLHLHSHYSILDGLGKVEDIVKKAKAMGAPAVALTDHGNITAMPELIDECEKHSLKPLVGCEFYVVDAAAPQKDEVRYHLTVIAKSWNGVKSIMSRLTIANDQFYKRPRLTWEQTLTFEDCIVMTACSFGVLAHDRWRQIAASLHQKYGADFYCEIMPHSVITDSVGLDYQKLVNERAIELHNSVGCGIVATNDAHYINEEDAYTHEILLAIQTRKKWDDPKRWTFGDTPAFYMRNIKEMVVAFGKYTPYVPAGVVKKAMLTTKEIADKCEIKMPKFEVHLPSIHDDDDAAFTAAIAAGWAAKVAGRPDIARYKERLIYEVGVIKKLGFVRYFLMVDDIIRYARGKGIMVGPARGSAAGSLVCYLMEITLIDPIAHDLYFERFLNPERIDLPDIDTDFQDNRRQEVFDYIRNKYGAEYTANINTLGVMGMSSAFRDVASVFGVPPFKINELSKLVEDEQSFDEVPELVGFRKTKEGRNIVEQALKLKGTIRQQGAHACGYLVSSHKLDEVSVLERRKDNRVVNWDMRLCEKFGLLKMDILGLSTLTVLNHARKLVQDRHGVIVDFEKISLNDDKVKRGFLEADTVGVFQFENQGMRQLLKDISADTFDVCTACTALYRPGSLESGETKRYVQVAQGNRYEDYLCDELKPILKPTRGVMVYQEQIMQIFVQLGGFSWAQADKMRKIIGKKLGADEFNKYRENFVAGCGKNDIDEAIANVVFDKMVEFARYSFNKCISGDTVLKRCASGRHKFKYDVRTMYKIKNDLQYAKSTGHAALRSKWIRQGGYGYGMSMFGDGRIRKNKILDIQPAGFREVLMILLEDNSFINVTDNHKFPTQIGEVEARLLKVGGTLFKCGEYEKSDFNYSLSGRKQEVNGKKYGSMCGFPRGRKNPGYIDGSFVALSEFKKCSLNICSECGKVGRIEVHHIDQNRSNNDHVNLKKLCPSCHKKADYKAGRTRRGEKGYPTKLVKIAKIEKVGIIDTWDVTMEQPHNFVTDMGIVTCNSHAVAYTTISWWAMYMKQHYPVEFYAAFLSYGPGTHFSAVVKDAGAHGITISLPDINQSTDKYEISETEDNTILAPLGVVLGVGGKAVDAILAARRQGVFLSMEDFIERVNRRAVHKGIQDKLYRAGAFASLGLREPDEDKRQKNYAELVPIFNGLPTIKPDGRKINMATINLLISEVSDCCTRHGKPYVMTPICGSRASIMVINNPVKGERENLSNKGTGYFLSVVKEFGFDKGDFYYTSAVKCFHDNQKDVSQECRGACMDFLKKEIAAVKPKLIICFAGQIARMFVSDKKPSMAKLSGEVCYNKEFDCYVLFSYSPQYAFYQEDTAGGRFIEAMKKLPEIFA